MNRISQLSASTRWGLGLFTAFVALITASTVAADIALPPGIQYVVVAGPFRRVVRQTAACIRVRESAAAPI
jgi:hypothetical protein